MSECVACGREKDEKMFDRSLALGGRRSPRCRPCVTKRYISRSREIEREYPALRGADTSRIELKAEDFQRIRELKAEGWSNIKLGKEFGCSRMTIARVLDGTKVPA
jgi:predicted DNA-binding protein (UPF0251 family)